MTQTQQVIQFMRRHGSITPKDAMQFGCYRLAARIYDARRKGYHIMADTGDGYARYYLCEHPAAVA